MGLDMYVYSLDKKHAAPIVDGLFVDGKVRLDETIDPLEVFYWRKHPDMHGMMELIYRERGGKDEQFNLTPVPLFEADIDRIEQAVLSRNLPKTEGFFFGESDEDDRELDLEFCKLARAELARGRVIWYDSWW